MLLSYSYKIHIAINCFFLLLYLFLYFKISLKTQGFRNTYLCEILY